jgi:uncharacterized protein (DUF1697 family)
MKTCIALLRGINVGGKNALPMPALVRLLEALGAKDVRTFIQSGNAVFGMPGADAAGMAARMAQRIRQDFGFEPVVLVMPRQGLAAAMAHNPFVQAQASPSTLHLGFMPQAPTHPDMAGLQALRSGDEAFYLIDAVFYLHTPDGFGRSRLAARAEKLLGVDVTYRNWRTVSATMDLAAQYK